MGLCGKFAIVIAAILAGLTYQTYRNISKPLPAPKLDLNEYWGPGDKALYKEDETIVGNRILYPDEVIDDLRKQLNRTIEFTEPLEGVGFEYGFNTNKLKEIITYWRDEYLPKWRSREIYLWRFPHFTTQIQGLRIHYLHTKFDDKPEGKTVFPVILLHGWPGSVREFYDMIPKLFIAEDTEYAFEVVVPSLPGYGWSQGSSKPGMSPAEIAVILRNLMLRLGYKKFFIQGGDWGSIIGSNMATLFPENVIGYHSNLCSLLSPLSLLKQYTTSLYPSLFVEDKYQDFFFPMSKAFTFMIEESGYFHLQATKPDTIGAALIGNPAGLAAYILEKFSTWTNAEWRKLADGGLEKRYTLEALLDNVMIYYLTDSITTSQRLYSEFAGRKYASYNMDRVQTNVPVGCARFKHDLMHSMDWILKDKFTNIVHSTYHKDGGHFIAFEFPDVLYKDFIRFVNTVVKTQNI